MNSLKRFLINLATMVEETVLTVRKNTNKVRLYTMEIKIYFCAVLYNEDSEIIQVTDAKKQAAESGAANAVPQVQNSKTTLSALYKEGWRLAHVVASHETNGYRLFLERD